LCNSSAGTFTLSLPDASSFVGKKVIRLTDVTDFALVITPALKLASAIAVSSVNYPITISVQSDGTDWNIMNNFNE
jgi:hypothetical protein